MNAADRIKTARRLAGLTQRELAARSGVAQPNIAAYENGQRTPSEAMLARLIQAAQPRPSALLARYRDEILRLAARNRAGNVRVFGSIARGEDTPDSDVDLLVSFQPGASLLDQAGLIADLEELLGRHVDVVSDRALTDRDHRIRAEQVAL
ncbi:MAG: helix-turn-helix domain-containing protein [Actinobacteria bacterium]|nr:helix-turn-helix domain-containing protein [Actinomycetota bacterium]MBO0786315.1 helix-turn-helix domain-containing protein [Actinomycetota bacterium]